jgi:adenylate kinase family enzyme
MCSDTTLHNGSGENAVAHRIHVIGGPGSGKSYIAARVAAVYGMITYDLDELFWDRGAGTYGVRADPKERDRALALLSMQEAWVIEGAYYTWVTPSFVRADLIIILTPSVWLRDWRIIKRFALRRLGIALSAKQETVRALWQLLRWNHRYDQETLTPARVLIESLGKQTVECKTVSEVWAALASEQS